MTSEPTPLCKVVASLDAGYDRYLADISDILIRDGLIHRFECTYDLACRLLARSATADQNRNTLRSFPELIKEAHELGILAGDWNDWEAYRELRSLASRTNDDASAISIVAAIPKFLDEIGYLAKRLTPTIPSTVQLRSS